MTDKPIELDEHRGMAAQKATVARRELHGVKVDQEERQHRQEELDEALAAAPSTTWAEAAAKARYLIQLYALTAEAQEPRRRKLIEIALQDLAKLGDEPI